MKKVFVGGVVVGTVTAALVRLAPQIRQRAVTTCLRAFEAMPDELPPKPIIRRIEKIQDQNARILRLLEGQDQRDAAHPGREVSA
jgi:hypothetical protein